MLTNLVQKINKANRLEPVVVINNLKRFIIKDGRKLSRQRCCVLLDNLAITQITLLLFAVRITNHTGCATNE